jgi:hypothetical protein
MMKITDNIWFVSFQGVVGIVIGEDEVTGERKAYIGIGSGVSIEHDMQMIALDGCKLTPEIAAHVADMLNPKNKTVP